MNRADGRWAAHLLLKQANGPFSTIITVLILHTGTANGSTSELSYRPQSERDYGALSCRGTNAVGRQAEPCIFQVVPAGKSF